MRTGPAVLATLSRWYPDFPFTIRLFDANSERLDLSDLLLRQLLDSWNDEIPATATQNAEEAVEGTTDLIITMHEDCARRMLGGKGSSESLAYFVEADDLHLYLGGDRNRPTPVDQLSEQTRRLLDAPKRQGDSREEVIELASREFIDRLEPGVRIVSLMRGVGFDCGREMTHLNWPAPIEEQLLPLVPHQILRWVRGDEKISELGEVADQSPLMTWLKESEAR